MDFGFSFDDDLFDTSAADAILLAKAQRIQLARAAASTYSAKIEQALWFNDVDPNDKGRKTIRSPQLTSVQYDYFKKDYRTVLERGLVLLHDVKEGNSDEIEIIDMVLRAALKFEGDVDERILLVAAKWDNHCRSSPGLSYSAAQIYQKAQLFPQAIDAILSAIICRGPLVQYRTLLTSLFTQSFSPLHIPIANLLNDDALRRETDPKEVEAAVDKLDLSDERRGRLIKLLSTFGEEESEEVPRDVRSL